MLSYVIHATNSRHANVISNVTSIENGREAQTQSLEEAAYEKPNHSIWDAWQFIPCFNLLVNLGFFAEEIHVFVGLLSGVIRVVLQHGMHAPMWINSGR